MSEHQPTATGSSEFWFNIKTGEVEEGKQSAAAHRMGPYDTRDEAARAYEIAQARNAAADDEDRREDD